MFKNLFAVLLCLCVFILTSSTFVYADAPTGDADCNGEVNINDMTPIGHWQNVWVSRENILLHAQNPVFDRFIIYVVNPTEFDSKFKPIDSGKKITGKTLKNRVVDLDNAGLYFTNKTIGKLAAKTSVNLTFCGINSKRKNENCITHSAKILGKNDSYSPNDGGLYVKIFWAPAYTLKAADLNQDGLVTINDNSGLQFFGLEATCAELYNSSTRKISQVSASNISPVAVEWWKAKLDSCLVTDSGGMASKGSATNKLDGAPFQSLRDKCDSNGLLLQLQCLTDGRVSYKAAVACPAGKKCSSGACIASSQPPPSPPPPVTCTDPDGKNSNPTLVKTTVTIKSGQSLTDKCKDQDTVIEASCSGNAITSKELNCETGSFCIEGACKKLACRDSDSYYYVNQEKFISQPEIQGALYAADPKQQTDTLEDTCQVFNGYQWENATNCHGTGCRLVEYSCMYNSSDFASEKTVFNTPNGCYYGAKAMNDMKGCVDLHGSSSTYSPEKVDILLIYYVNTVVPHKKFSEIVDKAREMVNTALLVKPFNEPGIRAKINIYMEPSASKSGTGRLGRCPADHLVQVYEDSIGPNGSPAYSRITSSLSPILFLHETMGHGIGHLQDEYVDSEGKRNYIDVKNNCSQSQPNYQPTGGGAGWWTRVLTSSEIQHLKTYGKTKSPWTNDTTGRFESYVEDPINLLTFCQKNDPSSLNQWKKELDNGTRAGCGYLNKPKATRTFNENGKYIYVEGDPGFPTGYPFPYCEMANKCIQGHPDCSGNVRLDFIALHNSGCSNGFTSWYRPSLNTIMRGSDPLACYYTDYLRGNDAELVIDSMGREHLKEIFVDSFGPANQQIIRNEINKWGQ